MIECIRDQALVLQAYPASSGLFWPLPASLKKGVSHYKEFAALSDVEADRIEAIYAELREEF